MKTLSQKITKRTKIRHKKLLTKSCLNKGYVLKIIACDDHIINIERNSPTTRQKRHKKHIMSIGKGTNRNDHRCKALKPRMWSLLEAIKGAS
jgi:hypothetical protein